MLAGVNQHPLGDKHAWVETSDLLDAKEATVVDVADEKPDFIEVSGDCHARTALAVPDANQVAECVDAHGIDERFEFVRYNLPDQIFARCDPRRLRQFAEQWNVDRHFWPF
jgi:hypothetical protein